MRLIRYLKKFKLIYIKPLEKRADRIVEETYTRIEIRVPISLIGVFDKIDIITILQYNKISYNIEWLPQNNSLIERNSQKNIK